MKNGCGKSRKQPAAFICTRERAANDEATDFVEGLGKMKAGDIDARLARRPIERYEWPLGAALASARCFNPDHRSETRARKILSNRNDCL